jgi:hypothetical protein
MLAVLMERVCYHQYILYGITTHEDVQLEYFGSRQVGLASYVPRLDESTSHDIPVPIYRDLVLAVNHGRFRISNFGAHIKLNGSLHVS